MWKRLISRWLRPYDQRWCNDYLCCTRLTCSAHITLICHCSAWCGFGRYFDGYGSGSEQNPVWLQVFSPSDAPALLLALSSKAPWRSAVVLSVSEQRLREKRWSSPPSCSHTTFCTALNRPSHPCARRGEQQIGRHTWKCKVGGTCESRAPVNGKKILSFPVAKDGAMTKI